MSYEASNDELMTPPSSAEPYDIESEAYPTSSLVGIASVQPSPVWETRRASTASPQTTASIVEINLASVIAEWNSGSLRGGVAPTQPELAPRPTSVQNGQHDDVGSLHQPSFERPTAQPTALYDSNDLSTIPACVRDAVLSYKPLEGFSILPKGPRERSVIFKYGVRLQTKVEDCLMMCWSCLASQACRDAFTTIPLSKGSTSKATLHLSAFHNVTSEKTVVETTRKRSRDEEVARILASSLCRADTKRLAVLLETQRIVNNNLPFSFGEYHVGALMLL